MQNHEAGATVGFPSRPVSRAQRQGQHFEFGCVILVDDAHDAPAPDNAGAGGIGLRQRLARPQRGRLAAGGLERAARASGQQYGKKNRGKNLFHDGCLNLYGLMGSNACRSARTV